MSVVPRGAVYTRDNKLTMVSCLHARMCLEKLLRLTMEFIEVQMHVQQWVALLF